MRIQNYRNLQDVEMTFHERANYIVGENAIGKSGLLRLISYMSAGRNVEEDDYADVTRPIIITLDLHLLQSEKEYFADTPGEHRQSLRVRMEMHVSDMYPHLYDDNSGEELPLELIRRLRYVSYSAAMPEEQRVPPRIYRALEQKLSNGAKLTGTACRKKPRPSSITKSPSAASIHRISSTSSSCPACSAAWTGPGQTI